MNAHIPEILAPAGDKNAFLAAVAAGADAIYCGLKIFSARMEAQNFSTEELARLCALAREEGVRVYIAFNAMVKQGELDKVLRILTKLVRYVDFQALIIQDLSLIPLARKAGYEGEFHLSTLANCTHPKGLETAKALGVTRVVLPREFNLDEIRAMADHVPAPLNLEVFVHGALCYSVSGRCYWSSWFGGKSALRGRCVQPCRRLYEQKGEKKRLFSCMDFSADVLAKVLKEIPQIMTWKIEGRKKSPHYVYYTVKAYKLLRDDPKQKRDAMALLEYAMGRQFSHYNLLSHRRLNPLEHGSETGSGLFLGRVKNPQQPYFVTREELFPGDLLRIGYEEDQFHDIQRVPRAIPKKGKFFLSAKAPKKVRKGTPVFIIDRRGRELESRLMALDSRLAGQEKIKVSPGTDRKDEAVKNRKLRARAFHEMRVVRGRPPAHKGHQDMAFWISGGGYGIRPSGRTWLWLDPLLFPEEEQICLQYVKRAVQKGAKNFVLNAPWQISLFPRPERLNLWAGPFCNIANGEAVTQLKNLGFSGAIVSPELDKETVLSLPGNAPLPLGIVIQANWPLAVSRIISPDLSTGKSFFSPKGEGAWTMKSNATYYTFPTWQLDISSQADLLKKAGYTMLIRMEERIPKGIKLQKRPGMWNWHLNLL